MRRALTTGPAARPGPKEEAGAVLDRLLEAKPAGDAPRPGVTPLMQKHLDDIEVAGACGCEHRSFTTTVSR